MSSHLCRLSSVCGLHLAPVERTPICGWLQCRYVLQDGSEWKIARIFCRISPVLLAALKVCSQVVLGSASLSNLVFTLVMSPSLTTVF